MGRYPGASEAAASRAGLPEVTFHDLRHTATTRLASVIGDPMELVRFTGHLSIQVLMRYYNPKGGGSREALRLEAGGRRGAG